MLWGFRIQNVCTNIFGVWAMVDGYGLINQPTNEREKKNYVHWNTKALKSFKCNIIVILSKMWFHNIYKFSLSLSLSSVRCSQSTVVVYRPFDTCTASGSSDSTEMICMNIIGEINSNVSRMCYYTCPFWFLIWHKVLNIHVERS